MIRFTLPLLALALMSCTGLPLGEPMPIPPTTACGAENLGSFIGKTRTDAIAAEVARISGAKGVRWISPGMAVTMDYREDRLNVDLDDKGVIQRFHCG